MIEYFSRLGDLMDKMLKEKLVNLLKNICNEKIIQNIKLVNINDNRKLILKGIMFDNEHTCYHSYDSLEDVITGLMVSANNYGIYLENEFIGIVSVFNHYYKDSTRLEISMSIKNEYRNKKIGKYCLNIMINKCFEDPKNKSIHLSIREDNIKSRKIAERCGFKLYKGYKCDNMFIDSNGNMTPQFQYLLKRKDHLNK